MDLDWVMEMGAEKHTLNIRVEDDRDGLRVDKYLATVEQIGSRSFAQSLIANGHVTVDGRLVRKSGLLTKGSVLRVKLPRVDKEKIMIESAHYKVAYSDEYLVVIDKPAGMVVHPAPSHKGSVTLTEAMSNLLSDQAVDAEPRLVHRLDKDTSGLLIVAWDLGTQRLMQQMIREREVSRNYYALVEGLLDAHSGTIDAPIGRDKTDRSIMSIDTRKPREARTHFEVVEFMANTTFVKVKLETGRTHQVRAHFTAICHPLVGDSTYGRKHVTPLERQFLHSFRLSFKHPHTGQDIAVESELPEDLDSALKLARSEA